MPSYRVILKVSYWVFPKPSHGLHDAIAHTTRVLCIPEVTARVRVRVRAPVKNGLRDTGMVRDQEKSRDGMKRAPSYSEGG